MTSRIIVAIVAVFAVVLSLAAPVDVDAQTPTLTVERNTVGAFEVVYSGFTSGTYYRGSCGGRETFPASCTFSSGAPVGGGHPCVSFTATASGTVIEDRNVVSPRASRPHWRFAVYSDSACTTEVAHVTVTRSKAYPTWRVRDVGFRSATVYIADAHSTHNLTRWFYRLTPPGICREEGDGLFTPGVWSTESPVSRLTGLSVGTEYTYDARVTCIPDDSSYSMGSVTFTTPTPLPPEPPTEVETTTDGNSSVTISWSNPGDPDIASYEYQLRQAGGPVGEWTTIPGSNADTTSVTIDLATGEARTVNNVTPMVEWTIHLRARDVNGNAGGIFTTTVNTAEDGTTVPALPLAGLAILALFLFMSGQRKRKGG